MILKWLESTSVFRRPIKSGATAMSDYGDYRQDEEDFFRELDELAKGRQAVQFKRRLRELAAKVGKSTKQILRYRGRIVHAAMTLRPDWSEGDATAWVDGVNGLEPPN
jgi:hypothetical protein